MMRSLIVIAVFVMCGTGAQSKPDSLSAARALANPYAQFGFDALRELATHHPDTNTFISPTSIAVALAMASNGASGTTRDAILATLHSDPSVDAFNAANRALVEQMGNTTAVQLSMANALWLQEGFHVNPSFNQVLQADYSAQAENLDFRNPSATQTINAWIAKHTNDRIPRLLDRIDPATVVILTNAIAFKGKWTLPFDPKATQSRNFKDADGAAHAVPMMKHTARYDYASANGLEAIRLPYSDRTFAMYIVLPQDATRMQSFLQQLTPEEFTKLATSLEARGGTIDLPRFTIKYQATLNTVLAKLGMGIAFSNQANFRGINETNPLHISEVRHASFLSIDEEGTEAAAATSVGIRTLAMRVEPPPFHMVVDHPFFIAIRDERNGQILFTGIIANPVN